jgi:hypothetical protein
MRFLNPLLNLGVLLQVYMSSWVLVGCLHLRLDIAPPQVATSATADA